jgi:hypothetical protein
MKIETQISLLKKAKEINIEWLGFDLHDLVLFVTSFLDDSDLNILKQIRIDEIREKDSDTERVYNYFPGFQDHPAHQLGVRLLAILIDSDHQELSEAVPSLGLTGSYSSFFLLSDWDWLCKGTIIHDVTNSLAQAGFRKLNKEIFYFESSVPSAIMAPLLFLVKKYNLGETTF